MSDSSRAVLGESVVTGRRQFLRAGVAAAAAGVAAPMVLAQSKAEPALAVVGEGSFRYECHHGWGQLPEKAGYGGASHGIALDAQGHIYISHQGSPGSVFVFDPQGKFVRSFGQEFRGEGHGIDIRKEGSEEFVYLAPSGSQYPFAKTNLKGEIVWTKSKADIGKDMAAAGDKRAYGDKSRYRPTNCSFRPDGGYYLGDGYGSNLIHEYDKNDKYVRSIGGDGKGDGQFSTPHGQWLDERDGTPKLVVADRANKRLQWFGMDGKHVLTVDGFLFPADIDVQGEYMLVPDLHCRITILDKANKPVAQLGDDAEWRGRALAGFKMRGQPDQWKPGRFIHPHDAKFLPNGDILVAEWVAGGRVTLLRKLA